MAPVNGLYIVSFERDFMWAIPEHHDDGLDYEFIGGLKSIDQHFSDNRPPETKYSSFFHKTKENVIKIKFPKKGFELEFTDVTDTGKTWENHSGKRFRVVHITGENKDYDRWLYTGGRGYEGVDIGISKPWNYQGYYGVTLYLNSAHGYIS